MALIAGLAMAQVQSANTVGFMDIKDENAAEGFNVVCPTFTTVGYNTVTLSDISLVGDDVAVRQDNLQIFDADGNADCQYQWRAAGWYDLDTREYVNDEVIDRAQGVVIDSYNGGISIRSVGEVNVAAIEVENCVEGFNVVGNPLPVNVTLGDVTLEGDDVTVRQDNLQLFDGSGNAEYQYQWRASGWYDLDTREYVNDETFPAGQGAILDCYSGGDVTFTIAVPNALSSL
jgi:hypothetical protein